jgi:hypothetical protein
MWYEATANARPDTIDSTSSSSVIYLRKDIKEVTIEDEMGETRTVYQYLETKIPKEAAALLEAQTASNSRLDDIEEVLVEILGGEGV